MHKPKPRYGWTTEAQFNAGIDTAVAKVRRESQDFYTKAGPRRLSKVAQRKPHPELVPDSEMWLS